MPKIFNSFPLLAWKRLQKISYLTQLKQNFPAMKVDDSTVYRAINVFTVIMHRTQGTRADAGWSAKFWAGCGIYCHHHSKIPEKWKCCSSANCSSCRYVAMHIYLATSVHDNVFPGTTCMATAFDIFGTSTFPLVLLDESSQLMEPLSLVPIVRFQSSRLIMIGDPLQLPPTLTTSADEDKVGQGLDKTLFDRLTEVSMLCRWVSNASISINFFLDRWDIR